MFWVLQNNIFNEYGYTGLIKTLDKYEISYAEVKVIPFIHKIEPDINPTGPVIVSGSTSMTIVAKRKGWKPGSFNNENYEITRKRKSNTCINPGGIGSVRSGTYRVTYKAYRVTY